MRCGKAPSLRQFLGPPSGYTTIPPLTDRPTDQSESRHTRHTRYPRLRKHTFQTQSSLDRDLALLYTSHDSVDSTALRPHVARISRHSLLARQSHTSTQDNHILAKLRVRTYACLIPPPPLTPRDPTPAVARGCHIQATLKCVPT